MSGGIDSAAALYLTRGSNPVRALTFEFHGIARSELRAARAVGRSAGIVEHRFVRLPDLKEAGEIRGFDLRGLPRAYIPMRNAIFYSLAASIAEETGADTIVGGHNRDDERVFEDVGGGFFSALQKAFRAASPVLRGRGLRIERPLRLKTKPQVVRLAATLGVPFGLTWSCHRDGSKHCWECDGCASRALAFTKAGINDPLAGAGREKIT